MIYNDFLVLILNDIFIPILSILIYMWDSLVQLIGFFMYVTAFSCSANRGVDTLC